MRLTRISEYIGMIPRQEDYPSKAELLKKYGYDENSKNMEDYYDAKKQFEEDWLRRYRREEADKRKQTEEEIQAKSLTQSEKAEKEKKDIENRNKRQQELQASEEEVNKLHIAANNKTISKISQILGNELAKKDDSFLFDLNELIKKYPQYHSGSLFEKNSVEKFSDFRK